MSFPITTVWIDASGERGELSELAESLSAHGDAVDAIDPTALPYLETTWFSGGPRTVATQRTSGESQGDWKTRHFEAVAAAHVDYPPDESDE